MPYFRFIIICLLFLGLIQTNAQGEITHLELTFPETNGYSMHGFAETNPGTVVAVGLASTVLRSEDWGSTWTQIQAPTLTAPDYYDVQVIEGGNLVAVGQAPGIFLSKDGGFTWSTPNLPAGSLFREVSLKPNGNISAAGENGIILVSADQGLTWENVGQGNSLVRDQLWLTNEICLTISNDGIRRTTDAGETWDLVQDNPFLNFEEVFQASGSHLVAIGSFKRYDSFDDGATWALSEFPLPNYPRNTVVIDSLHWVLSEFGEGAEVHETFDGGETWNFRLYRPTAGMTNIIALSNGRKLASSSEGLIILSDDNFATFSSAWQSLLVDKPNTGIQHIVQREDGVLFASGSNFSGPYYFSWLRSDDQGDSWQVLESGPNSFITDLKFGPSGLALASGGNQIRYSNDNGLNWFTATTDAGMSITELAIADESRCFATANFSPGGDLLESTDGGATWTTVSGSWQPGHLQYGHVSFIDSQTGWITAQTGGGIVLHQTLDGGSSWQQITTEGLVGRPSVMLWVSLEEGYIGGRHGTAASGLYRTRDGGLNWEHLTTNRTTRINLGQAGEILTFGLTENDDTMSTDGGLTWGPVFNPFRTPFNQGQAHSSAAIFLGDRWLMAGANAQIFNLSRDVLTSVDTAKLPAFRNRMITASPNPFNPGTTIKMNIPPNTGLVTLEIFDSRGAKIRQLWQGIPSSEALAVFWDGRTGSGHQTSSGIYLARLTGKDFQAFGKLTLVK